jgi:tRNA A37 threonylcarbamoyladenosine dehydratase
LNNSFLRTELLIGKEKLDKLKKSKIAVFGVGGVGSFVVEALVRSGIGSFILVDDDKVDVTNLNRQIHATTKTIGKYKVDLIEKRILEINTYASVKKHKIFYKENIMEDIIDNSITHIVDAIDTITSKIDLILKAKELNIPIISCMGTGNKLDPNQFEITDIYKTSVCPLAKVIRKEMKKRKIKKLKVIYSKEKPIKPVMQISDKNKRIIPASISYVPATAGMIIASEVIKEIIYKDF